VKGSGRPQLRARSVEDEPCAGGSAGLVSVEGRIGVQVERPRRRRRTIPRGTSRPHGADQFFELVSSTADASSEQRPSTALRCGFSARKAARTALWQNVSRDRVHEDAPGLRPVDGLRQLPGHRGLRAVFPSVRPRPGRRRQHTGVPGLLRGVTVHAMRSTLSTSAPASFGLRGTRLLVRLRTGRGLVCHTGGSLFWWAFSSSRRRLPSP
jgi:hypothetical protein